MYIVKTTTGTARDAGKISREIVRRGLCACAWTCKISSVYRWKGRMHSGMEYLVEFKCLNMKAASAAAKAIARLHKYEVPFIEITKAGPVNPAYAKWLAEETG